ncbi:MAG: alpha/beta fold hydrolase [Elusimicrobiaceae bacterium]|nr:alpha/beta fold hydrolase [Elusimicrobiaceae bacterium]
MLYVILLIVVVIIWSILSRVGTYIIFRPQKKRWPLQLPFRALQHGKLTGVYLPATEDRPTLVFFHGRGGNVSHFENFAHTYAPLGYGIIMWDYRGFGLSKGCPNQAHLEEDAISMVDYTLNTLKIAPQNIVLYGHSLGNAAALFAAANYKNIPLRALVLQSPFLSTPDMAASWAVHAYTPKTLRYRLVRLLVTPFLWFNRFDNTRLTSNLTLPVLLCISKEDVTLPWQQSAKLADGIVGVHRFLSSKGGHDEFAWTGCEVDQFIQTLD